MLIIEYQSDLILRFYFDNCIKLLLAIKLISSCWFIIIMSMETQWWILVLFGLVCAFLMLIYLYFGSLSINSCCWSFSKNIFKTFWSCIVVLVGAIMHYNSEINVSCNIFDHRFVSCVLKMSKVHKMILDAQQTPIIFA